MSEGNKMDNGPEADMGPLIDIISEAVETDIHDKDTRDFARRLLAEFITSPRFEFLSCNIWSDVDKNILN